MERSEDKQWYDAILAMTSNPHNIYIDRFSDGVAITISAAGARMSLIIPNDMELKWTSKGCSHPETENEVLYVDGSAMQRVCCKHCGFIIRPWRACKTPWPIDREAEAHIMGGLDEILED